MGALNILAKTAKAASEADKALPLRLARATPKTQAEIDALATRVSKQMLGEHVGSGKPKDTTNLAGRSRKENERVKGLDYVVEPTGAAKESVVYQPRKGDVNVAIPGDQTISDSILRRVGDIEGIDSHQQGGARYGLGKLDEADPLFWASGEGPAQMAQNKITRASEFYDPERVVGQHLAMGPVSNNFAMHFADANLRAMDYSKIKPKDMQAFDRLIANGYVKKNQKTGKMEHINFPEWPGIADPEGALNAMKANPELRKWFNDRMKTPKVTQPLGLPNGLDIQWAITEPSLRNMEVNLTGLSAGEMVPGASLTDTAAHNTYEKGIRGKALGHQEVLTPFTLSYPDAAQHIASTQRPQDFTGTIQKVFPHQIVDDQWLDEVAKYRELIKKYTGQKGGGEIHMSNFEKRLRGIKDEDDKETLRKVMALMAGMVKGQPTDIASQTFKGRDYKTKKNPNPTTPSMPSFAFKGKHFADGGTTDSQPTRFRLPNMRRGGRSPSKEIQDRPFYEPFTQGLGPMLYGAARGTAAGLAGAPGDLEELARMGINYVGEKAGKPNLVAEESALPTSERVLKKIPSLKDLGAGKEAQHSEDVASKLGMYGVSQIVAPKAGATLAKGAKKVGRELGETAAHKIATGQPLVPGVPASVTNPQVMHIIKPEGGNWRQIGKTEFGQNLKDSTSPRHMEGIRGNPKKVYEDTINKMDAVIERMKDAGQWNDETERAYANLRKQAENTYAIDTWVDSNLSNYVKKQMGTEKDPVRLLADQGITQFADEGAMRDALNWSYQQAADARKARKRLGMPEDPMSKTNMGRFWETATDDLIGNKTISAKEYKKKQGENAPDWLKQVPDSTPFYGIPPHGLGSELGFDHIIDVLKEDLAAGRIRPDQLNKVSMKQAVERTHQYNQDLAKAQELAKAKRLEGMTIHKEYPEGYKWVQLDKPGQFAAESEAMGHSVRGYEPPQGHPDYVPGSGNAGSESYGLGGWDAIKRGDAKVYSLVDKAGRPHTTIEVGTGDDARAFYDANKKHFNPVMDRELSMMVDPDLDIPLNQQRITAMKQLLDEAGVKYTEPSQIPAVIHQIKGKGNRAPNPEYQPYIQDFVRSGDWEDIGDLHNTGLKTLDQAFPNYEDAKNFSRANPNSRYVTQAEIDAYHKQVNEELLNEFGRHRIKPDPESKNTLGRNDLMTIRELAELEFPGDLQKQANMIRGAMQGTTEPGAYSGSIFPPLEEKKGGAISAPKFTLKMGVGGLLKNAVKAAKATKVAEQAKPATKTLWHGSPHHFAPAKNNPLGAFDKTKIGSGEGTQAYGYGHYLAEAKGNAEGYRHMLSVDPQQGSENIKFNTLEKFMPNEAPAVQREIKEFLDGTGNYADFVRVIKQQGSDNFKKALVAEEPELFKAGALYKVELPEEHLGKMLDYDLPWSQQPENVRQAIDIGGLQKFYNSEDIPVSQILYHAQQSMTPQQFAEFMRNKGVPGIKYKDAQSRGIREAEEGTRNIVIFPGNEDLLNIVGKEKRGGLIQSMQPHLGIGGFLKNAIKGAPKVAKPTPKPLPSEARTSGLEKFLEPSKVKGRMYHGTTKDISEFDPSKMGRNATFVTPDPTFADKFASFPAHPAETGANVMPVRVQVTNPFDYGNPEHIESLIQAAQKEFAQNPEKLEEVMKEIRQLTILEQMSGTSNNWANIEDPVVQKLIRDLGHDAYYTSEFGVKNLGIYDPRRIKSDIGNRGTYDTSEIDITRARGGLTKMRKQYA